MFQTESRPTIGLMATLLSTAPDYRGAGIHQYSQKLLTYLPEQAPWFDYRAFVMDRSYQPPAGVSVHFPARLSAAPVSRIFWEQTRIAWASRQLNLIHGFAYALPLALSVPAIVSIHDLSFIRFPEAFPSSKRRYLTHISQHSCRRAQAVIADSLATAKDIQHFLRVPEEKIHVVYPGVDERYRPLMREQVEARRRQKGWPEQFMLMIGTLEPRKNHLGLIEAYAIYRRRSRHPIPLLIGGGKGWYYNQIFQRVQALRLEKDVRFVGFVSWEDLPWLYNAATLFLYPSRYEGFGLPVVEAMRCGVPVVTSNVSSLPEVAGNAALTIDPDDPEALARSMLLLLEEEPERLQSMRTLGQKQAAGFTWEKTALQTADIYATVLNSTHG